MSSSNTPGRTRRRSPWGITLAYIAVGVAWIVLTDVASLGIGSRAGGPILTVSLIKGIFWIVSSGLLLHLLVFQRIERARAFEASVRRRLLEGEELGRFGIEESWAGETRPRWSRGMFGLWGRDPEEGEPDGAWIEARIAPEDLQRARQAADATARGETPAPYEIRVRPDDRIERVLQITTRAEREEDGRIRTLLVAQDVTELRALERNAAESLGLLRSVLESTAEGMIVVRVDTRELLLWNERFLELSKIPRSAAERLDSRVTLAELILRARNEEQVRARIEGIYRTPGAEAFDLIEMKDGTILERFTAPVELGSEVDARIWSFRDVTETIRARETLERRERQLGQSQKIANLGSFELDLETEELRWSDETFAIYGLDPAEPPGTLAVARELTVPEDLPTFDRAVEIARRLEKLDPMVFRIIRGDGAIRVVEARGEPLPSASGDSRLYVGTIRDITDEHESQRALAEAEERFRSTFEQAAVGIAHLSTDGVILRANQTLCEATGWARDELLGRPLSMLLETADHERAVRELREIGDGKEPLRSGEFRYRTRAGQMRWAAVTASAARLHGGQSYLIVVALDITERKEVEEERERLARQVRLLLGSTGAGLFTVDLEGRCTLINRAACESLGYSAEAILGQPMREIVYGGGAKVPSETLSAIFHANAGESTKLYNQRFVRRDGATLPVDVTVSPVREGGTIIGRAVSFVDVSDRMRLEEQLEDAKRLSSLGRLAASIAHEINNVLMGILPFAEIVARSGEAIYRNAGEQIRLSVRRGRGVTQEILRFARDEEPHRQLFEGRAWLQSVERELHEIAGRALSVTMPGDDFFLDADASQLAQVLINLVMNARDAVDPVTGTIALSVSTARAGTQYAFGALPDRGHPWIAIELTDNGAGMDAETLEHLFEPFFTKKRGGTGLGLPIAYRIVAAHGGLFFVESAEGRGSTFFVFLPAAEAAQQPAIPEIPGESLAGEVLLVEDDETVAAGLRHMLEEEGLRTRTVRTGAEAIEALESSRPTVMILDVGLPDMDGGAVCERALERWPGLPVVFSTGHGEQSRLARYLEKPNVRFLMKPYTFEQLRSAIQAAESGLPT